MKISDYNKSSVENWLTAHNLPHLIQTSILKQKIKCGKSYCKLERLVSDWKSRAYAIQRLQGKKEFTTCNDHFFLGTPPRKGSSRKQQPIAAESNVNIARETMLLGGNHILACDEILFLSSGVSNIPVSNRISPAFVFLFYFWQFISVPKYISIPWLSINKYCAMVLPPAVAPSLHEL